MYKCIKVFFCQVLCLLGIIPSTWLDWSCVQNINHVSSLHPEIFNICCFLRGAMAGSRPSPDTEDADPTSQPVPPGMFIFYWDISVFLVIFYRKNINKIESSDLDPDPMSCFGDPIAWFFQIKIRRKGKKSVFQKEFWLIRILIRIMNCDIFKLKIRIPVVTVLLNIQLIIIRKYIFVENTFFFH